MKFFINFILLVVVLLLTQSINFAYVQTCNSSQDVGKTRCKTDPIDNSLVYVEACGYCPGDSTRFCWIFVQRCASGVCENGECVNPTPSPIPSPSSTPDQCQQLQDNNPGWECVSFTPGSQPPCSGTVVTLSSGVTCCCTGGEN